MKKTTTKAWGILFYFQHNPTLETISNINKHYYRKHGKKAYYGQVQAEK
jgi:hypothetical protein